MHQLRFTSKLQLELDTGPVTNVTFSPLLMLCTDTLEGKLWPTSHIKKRRHYFANKGPSSQSYVFSSSHVWMWELDYKESWAPKNWCFWTVVLEKTLESPLDCRETQLVHSKGDQSWCSLEGLMLKLKLQYFGHLMQRADSLEKTLMLGKIEGGRRRGQQRMRCWMASPTEWTWVWVNSGSWWWTGRPSMLQSMGSQRVGHDWAIELNWTEQKLTCKNKGCKAEAMRDSNHFLISFENY